MKRRRPPRFVLVPAGGGNIDDAPVTLPRVGLDEGLRAQERAAQVYGKGVVEFVGGHFHDGLEEMGEGRVVDEYMDGAVPFRHPPEGLVDGLGLSQVGLDEANTVRQGFVLFHVESRDRIPRAL